LVIIKRVTRLILALIVILSLCNCGTKDKEKAPEKETETKAEKKAEVKQAPDFTLKKVFNDGNVTLSEYKGKVVILDFWATWCPPCRASIPNMNRLYDKYKAEGLQIIGISVDNIQTPQDEEKVQQFVKQYAMQYPVVFVDPTARSSYGGIPSIPTVFIIDREGNAISIVSGYSPELEEKMEQTIKGLLK